MATKRPTTFSMRMPEDLNEKINAYAAEHNCTKAEAMSHFARAGIELEENGMQPAAGQHDGSHETLQSIEARLEALQNLPSIEPVQQAAIVPVDIRDKIRSYSEENACSEQEALAYYARLGVQLGEETRQATNADVAELRTRLDALAQDSQKKSEQLAQMAEALVAIREYTKPEELELEGEVADDAEDVEQPELTEEERQRIADEHTRQIVSSVMEEYLGQDEGPQDARVDARPALNPWIPVLVAVIVSLLIGLVVVLTR